LKIGQVWTGVAAKAATVSVSLHLATKYCNANGMDWHTGNVIDNNGNVFYTPRRDDSVWTNAYFKLLENGNKYYGKHGALDRAEAAFTCTLQIDPANAKAHNALGILAEQKGDYTSAVEHFRTAVAFNRHRQAAFYQNNIDRALSALIGLD
jgi:tetratricopeptide (TPR) repeat protein